MNNYQFNKTLLIGMGLIGSSIARALKEFNISEEIYALEINDKVISRCKELKLLNKIKKNINEFDMQFDLIIICSPLSTYNNIFSYLDTFITKKTIITDVGSTKVSVINSFKSYIKNKNIYFVPSHPIAGLEKSGPEFGFANIFKNRFCILTPINKEDDIKTISTLWKSLGMNVEIMNAKHHDRILAMTSHIPQLIAYSIVFSASQLETNSKNEVLKYSAAGFRDFTRLAGSDPVMWRDVYSMNKEFVLEMLDRFNEDLDTLKKAIENGDTNFLEKTFSSTRKIRKVIEKIGQAGSFDPTEPKN